VGFPANPGDTITVQEQVVGTTTVRLTRTRSQVESVFAITIQNVTRNVSYTVPSSYTTVASAARASAEWVTEAPWDGETLPLADFGTVDFSGCAAASTLSGGKLEAINFWPSDPLTMVDPEGGQAIPSGLLNHGTAFSVTWSQ